MQAPILSPLQPKGPQKTVNISVNLQRHAIPPMLKHLSALALIATGAGAGTVMFAFEAGSAADIAGTIAFIAWNLAATEAILKHIITQTPDSRSEVQEEITRAAKTHLIIK